MSKAGDMLRDPSTLAWLDVMPSRRAKTEAALGALADALDAAKNLHDALAGGRAVSEDLDSLGDALAAVEAALREGGR